MARALCWALAVGCFFFALLGSIAFIMVIRPASRMASRFVLELFSKCLISQFPAPQPILSPSQLPSVPHSCPSCRTTPFFPRTGNTPAALVDEKYESLFVCAVCLSSNIYAYPVCGDGRRAKPARLVRKSSSLPPYMSTHVMSLCLSSVMLL